jgi:hypothetical protein
MNRGITFILRLTNSAGERILQPVHPNLGIDVRRECVSLSRHAIGIGALCIVALSISAIAAQPASRKGFTKVSIKYLFKQPNASAAAAIAGDGAVVLEDYDSYVLLSAPTANIERVLARAAAAGVGAAAHDEYDLLGLPGGTLDTRVGVLPPAGAQLIAEYPKDVVGLYILQFLGPLKPDWLNEIANAGGIVIEPIPVNGYLAALTPEAAARVAALPQVQFLGVYQPFQKAAMVDRGASEEQDVIVQLADAPGIEATIKELAARLGTLTETKNWGGHYVSGRLHSQDVASLLAMPLVIGVHRLTALQPSDERQAMSLTTHLTTSNGNTIPTLPGTYASWLTDPAACDVCGNLSDEGFIIGIADTGVDNGSAGIHHLDLQPANRVRYGRVFLVPNDAQGFCPPSGTQYPNICESPMFCFDCDGSFHGTFVSGVAAGNAATGKRDTSATVSGFFLGAGIAATAGILSTKILNSRGQMWTAYNIFGWASDATSRSVYIQNHSHNEYGAFPSATGMYTKQSHDFDVAVRDSDGPGPSLLPITLSVSAGNQRQDPVTNRILLLPPATAKNVIAVGGAESVRDASEWRNMDCGINSSPMDANSYDNIEADSKHGTLVQSGGHSWDTYAKPDLFAPVSQIVSARSTPLSPQVPPTYSYDCVGYGGNPPNYDPDYFIASGTSFAAPVGAGAALIASRIYAASLGGVPNPAAASPALLKAILVGSARSMRAGIDKATSPTAPIAARPNATQGFGRISLVDMVSHTPLRQYVDQAPARTFTAAGQQWSATYPVSDPNQPVKVVLVWTDAPAPAGVGNVPTLLQNDLDLSVNIGDSTNCHTYAGNNLTASTQMPSEGEESVLYSCGAGNPDTKNNTEMVVFFPAAAGVTQFTVVVDARIIGASAIPDVNCPDKPNSDCLEQDFALFVYNAGSPIICAAPSITTQPSPATIVTGQTATLSVAASGTAPLSYQWYTGTSGDTSSPVGGGTGASVTVSPITATSYWVRVTNSCGSADSVAVTVTVTVNTPSAATLFYLVTPCRVIDTRNANGPQGGPALTSGGTRNITVAGVCGIPTGVVAISINIAVVAPSAGGFMTLYTGPSSAPLPLASTINYQTNRTLANNGIVRVGSDTINVYDGGPNLDFVIDVNGYFK